MLCPVNSRAIDRETPTSFFTLCPWSIFLSSFVRLKTKERMKSPSIDLQKFCTTYSRYYVVNVLYLSVFLSIHLSISIIYLHLCFFTYQYIYIYLSIHLFIHLSPHFPPDLFISHSPPNSPQSSFSTLQTATETSMASTRPTRRARLFASLIVTLDVFLSVRPGYLGYLYIFLKDYLLVLAALLSARLLARTCLPSICLACISTLFLNVVFSCLSSSTYSIVHDWLPSWKNMLFFFTPRQLSIFNFQLSPPLFSHIQYNQSFPIIMMFSRLQSFPFPSVPSAQSPLPFLSPYCYHTITFSCLLSLPATLYHIIPMPFHSPPAIIQSIYSISYRLPSYNLPPPPPSAITKSYPLYLSFWHYIHPPLQTPPPPVFSAANTPTTSVTTEWVGVGGVFYGYASYIYFRFASL